MSETPIITEAVYEVTVFMLGAESERFVHRQPVPVEPAGAALYAKGAARREVESRLRPGESVCLRFLRFESRN